MKQMLLFIIILLPSFEIEAALFKKKGAQASSVVVEKIPTSVAEQPILGPKSVVTIESQKKALEDELVKVFDRILIVASALGNKEDAQAFMQKIFTSVENTLALKYEKIEKLPHRAGMRQLTRDEKEEILRQADEMKSSNVYTKYLQAHQEVIADETFEDEVIARAKLARERHIGFEYIKGYVEYVSKQTAQENIPDANK